MTRPRDPGGASVVLLVLLWAVAIVPLASFASAAPSSSDQSGGHDLADMFPERYSRDAGYVSVEVVGSSGTPACRANGTRAVTGTVAIEAGSGSGVYISGATTGEARCTSPRDDHSAPVDANGTPLVELDVHASANRGYFIAPGEVPVKMDGAKVRLEGYPVGAAAGATSVFDDLALDAGLTWVLRASGRVRTRSEDSGGIGEVVFAEGDVHSSATFDADGLFVPGSARARVSASVRVRLGAPEDEGTVGTATTAGARPSRVLLRAVVDYERPGCWDTRAVRADGVEATLSLGGGDADVTLVGDATFFCDANLDGDGKAFRFAVRRGTAGEPLRLKLGGSKRQAVEDVAVAVTGHVAPPAEAAKTLRAMDESSMANASVADAQKLAASSASAESTSETQPGGAAETAAAQGWLPFPDVAGLEISGTIVFVLAEVDKPSPARGLAWIAEASLDRSAGKVDAALELTYVDAPSVDANVQGALVEVATGAVRVHLASGSVRDGCKGGGAAAHGVVRFDARESMRAAFAVFGTRACERDGHAATWEMGATSVADVTVLNEPSTSVATLADGYVFLKADVKLAVSGGESVGSSIEILGSVDGELAPPSDGSLGALVAVMQTMRARLNFKVDGDSGALTLAGGKSLTLVATVEHKVGTRGRSRHAAGPRRQGEGKKKGTARKHKSACLVYFFLNAFWLASARPERQRRNPSGIGDEMIAPLYPSRFDSLASSRRD